MCLKFHLGNLPGCLDLGEMRNASQLCIFKSRNPSTPTVVIPKLFPAFSLLLISPLSGWGPGAVSVSMKTDRW